MGSPLEERGLSAVCLGKPAATRVESLDSRTLFILGLHFCQADRWRRQTQIADSENIWPASQVANRPFSKDFPEESKEFDGWDETFFTKISNRAKKRELKNSYDCLFFTDAAKR
jgi:hypothetical protein